MLQSDSYHSTHPSTYACLLQSCAANRALPEAKLVHTHTIQTGFQSKEIFLGNKFVTMYAKCGRLVDAHRFFDQMPQRDVVSWTVMIAAYSRHGHGREALAMFYQMKREGIQADEFTFVCVLLACSSLGSLEDGKRIHEDILRRRKPDSDTFSSVLQACANLAVWEFGKAAHEDILRNGFQSDIYVENALVDVYANSSIRPDRVTFIGILSACCHAGLLEDAWNYFHCMDRDYQISPEMEHYCCMVDVLGRVGHLHEAHDFINKMPIIPDASMWGSLLGACRIHRHIELGGTVAELLFELEPKNAAHYVLLSNIYADAGRWDDIEKVRKLMRERKVKKNAGWSWIEVNKHLHTFHVGDDTTAPQIDNLCNDGDIKENILGYHNEKLAIAYGLINAPLGTPIRIIKNLKVCSDCHYHRVHSHDCCTRNCCEGR
eukprot:PITA_01239